MNRREFVAASSAVAATLAYRPTPAATATENRLSFDVSFVVFDRRFAASRAFGAAALSMNQRVHAIDGDVTALWTEHLDPLWRGGWHDNTNKLGLPGAGGRAALVSGYRPSRASDRRGRSRQAPDQSGA